MQQFLNDWQQAIEDSYTPSSPSKNVPSMRELTEYVQAHCDDLLLKYYSAEHKAYIKAISDIYLGGMDSPKNDPRGAERGLLCMVLCMAVFEPKELMEVVIDDLWAFKSWWRAIRFEIKDSRYDDLRTVARDLEVLTKWQNVYKGEGEIIWTHTKSCRKPLSITPIFKLAGCKLLSTLANK